MFKSVFIKFFILSGLLITAVVGCNTTESKKDIPADCSTVHWTYTGESGPKAWPDLCTGYSACGGKSQSPINIAGAIADASLDSIKLNYTTTPVEIENNGHTIEFVCEEGSKVTLGGTEYELLQFHFHGLSEHEVNGKHYPLEVHFVNKATDTNYAVIGLFIEEGAENPLFTQFLSHFPRKEGQYKDTSTLIDLSSLFPENLSYYTYSGSLTTPPCSEVVNWYVLKNTVTASATQISEFQAILHNNYRPVQDLNGRSIKMYDK